jgi:hypothetical protein
VGVPDGPFGQAVTRPALHLVEGVQ